MSSSKTRNSKSSSTAATAVTATGVPQDAVATTSSASDPSGLRAPDGTNSSDTPPKSGDAASEASADLVKPQVTSEHTATILVGEDNNAPLPEEEASASGNSSSGPSQGEEIGAGANAGSGHAAFDLAGILIATGTASIEHLIRVSSIGKNVLVILEEVATKQPRFQEWLGADDPADIIAALAEEVDVLQRTVDLLEDAADDVDLNQDRPSPSAVRVKAHRSGFRRAGLVLSADWQGFAAGVLTVKQVDALDADPNIDVEPLT
ncbi:MAG: hypothetical protein PGN20_15350 [Agrobacterium cavarae]